MLVFFSVKLRRFGGVSEAGAASRNPELVEGSGVLAAHSTPSLCSVAQGKLISERSGSRQPKGDQAGSEPPAEIPSKAREQAYWEACSRSSLAATAVPPQSASS